MPEPLISTLGQTIRRLWSRIVPVPVEVQLVSNLVQTGQLEVWPEYSVAGRKFSAKELPSSFRGEIAGYKVRVPENVRQLAEEFRDKRLRVRPSAISEWLRKYKAKGIDVIDHSTGRQVTVRQAEVEIDATLTPDDTLAVKSTLITDAGVEIDPSEIESIPDEKEWFRLGETIYQKPEVSPELNSIIEGSLNTKLFDGDDVPEILSQIERNQSRIRSASKNTALENQAVTTTAPINTVRVDGDSDSLQVDHTLNYERPGGGTLEESVENVEALLKSRRRSATYRRVKQGWIRVEKSHVDQGRSARQPFSKSIQAGDAITGIEIPKALAALAALANELQQISPWNIICSERVQRHHRLVDTPAEVTFPVNVLDIGDGESVLQIEPTYKHEKTALRHEVIGESLARHEDWIRGQRVWIKLDRAKYEAVERFIQKEALRPAPNGGYVVNPADWDRLRDELEKLGRIEQTHSFREFLQKLAQFERIEYAAPPRTLNASLRPYQQHGLNWLVFLRRFGLNGILADDMGLGKTVQTLAAIAHSREHKARGAEYPSLIVCPPSLIANWKAESEKFVEGVRVVEYRGSSRERLRAIMHRDADIVIGSYDVVSSDHTELNDLPWNYLIVDEAHSIRNPGIRRSRNIKKIGAARKLALTGTPVQNSARDVWSLFDFVMPSYLGNQHAFERRYTSLCDRRMNLDEQEAKDLHSRTRAFMLRRLKKEVAGDLPEIVECDRIVELEPAQKYLYRNVLGERKTQELLGKVRQDDYKTQGLNIFQVLSRLRNICNDPSLVTGKLWNPDESAKILALQELLEEVKEGEHRALIFSQFTRVLDILENLLPNWGMKSIRLDGSTPAGRRQDLVNEFNRNEKIDCFLITTKAGGQGLNLVGADTVIFYDHDWNPQNDEQAKARAHRIGQKRTVTVYRLVTKGTIEEQMLRIQARKKMLAQALVTETPQGFMNITRDELLSLFEFEGDKSTGNRRSPDT